MADTSLQKNVERKVYRNIAVTDMPKYRLPIIGIASIVHRATGVALFVGMILLLPMLQMSLKSEAGFEAFRGIIWANPMAKIVLLALLFALIYHIFAGIRHIIQDSNKWLELAAARASAQAVFVLSALVTVLLAWRLW